MIDGKITNFLEIIVSVEYFGKSGGEGGMFSTLQVPVYMARNLILCKSNGVTRQLSLFFFTMYIV